MTAAFASSSSRDGAGADQAGLSMREAVRRSCGRRRGGGRGTLPGTPPRRRRGTGSRPRTGGRIAGGPRPGGPRRRTGAHRGRRGCPPSEGRCCSGMTRRWPASRHRCRGSPPRDRRDRRTMPRAVPSTMAQNTHGSSVPTHRRRLRRGDSPARADEAADPLAEVRVEGRHPAGGRVRGGVRRGGRGRDGDRDAWIGEAPSEEGFRPAGEAGRGELRRERPPQQGSLAQRAHGDHAQPELQGQRQDPVARFRPRSGSGAPGRRGSVPTASPFPARRTPTAGTSSRPASRWPRRPARVPSSRGASARRPGCGPGAGRRARTTGAGPELASAVRRIGCPDLGRDHDLGAPGLDRRTEARLRPPVHRRAVDEAHPAVERRRHDRPDLPLPVGRDIERAPRAEAHDRDLKPRRPQGPGLHEPTLPATPARGTNRQRAVRPMVNSGT